MNRPNPCPNCGKSAVGIWRIMGSRKYVVECNSCHWFGKTRRFRWRAIRAWNREGRMKTDGRP